MQFKACVKLSSVLGLQDLLLMRINEQRLQQRRSTKFMVPDNT